MKLLKLKSLGALLLVTSISFAQLPSKVLVGYWENWKTLRLRDVDERYNVICLAFWEADRNLVKDDNVVSDLEFTPRSKSQLKADIPVVQAQGRKVIMSIGGANGSFKLNNTADKNTFVEKTKNIITEYGVDGIDIDIERSVYICPSSNQSLSSPQTHIQLLIDGCKELLSWYQSTYGKKMILTTAPEVAYTIGGTSPWNDCNGALLPFIEQLRDDIDLLMIQLYNSGSIYPIPGYSYPSYTTTYAQGTSDFVVAATEATIEGFRLPSGVRTSGTYSGFPANKTVVALPTCSGAGSGGLTNSVLEGTMKYLIGSAGKIGTYSLKNGTGYPDLRGIMGWSINADASCSPSDGFAQTFENVFGTIDPDNVISAPDLKDLEIYPNPTNNLVNIASDVIVGEQLTLTDLNGKIVTNLIVSENLTKIDVSNFAKGIYTLRASNYVGKVIVK